MEQSSTPPGAVNVNLILATMRLEGTIALDLSQRVSDILITPEEKFLLKHVSVTSLEGSRIESYPELMVDKRQVLAVVPKESSGHIVSRRLTRMGIGTPNMASLAVGVILPPFNVQGILHAQAPFSLSSIMARLGRFFAITNATMYFNRIALEDDVTLLLNRELVAGFGPLEETASQRLPTSQPANRAL